MGMPFQLQALSLCYIVFTINRLLRSEPRGTSFRRVKHCMIHRTILPPNSFGVVSARFMKRVSLVTQGPSEKPVSGQLQASSDFRLTMFIQ
jgi:hypothetical protein